MTIRISAFPFVFMALVGVFFLLFFQQGHSQELIQLQDLSSFKNPPASWKIVGDVTADLEKDNKLNIKEGRGVLVNLPAKKTKGADLYTAFEHGDIDIELEFMMAKGSNSGIYLQGMYEVQLLDSWGDTEVSPAANGGIYQRWDESRPEGQKGYEGYSPRQNVSRAPGLWQRLKISFQAPRFNDQGKKIENAKILHVILNGVLIHENVELFGPTRGAFREKETAKGPLRFQGDHGAVAFQNIAITNYGKARPVLTNLSYHIYEGKHEKEPFYDSLPPEAEGTSVILTSDLSPRPQRFLIRYSGVLDVKEAGEYNFNLTTKGGSGMLNINNEEVIPLGSSDEGSRKGKVTLPAGELPFVLLYSKFVDWYAPALGLTLRGPGVRDYLISEAEELKQAEAVDPILVNPRETPILRSFMDMPDGPRLAYAISVGSPQTVHYTYDLSHGALVQVWRGNFLDATPMWHDRGDGSSRPQGSVLHLMTKPELTVAHLSTDRSDWVPDTAKSSYVARGYRLITDNHPVFLSSQYGSPVEDNIEVMPNGRGLKRTITVSNPKENLYVRVAKGSTIEETDKGLYLIDNKAYYLKIDETAGGKPVIRKNKADQELVVPVKGPVTYSILF